MSTRPVELRDAETVVQRAPAAGERRHVATDGVHVTRLVQAAVVGEKDRLVRRAVEARMLEDAVMVRVRGAGRALPPADLGTSRAAVRALPQIETADDQRGRIASDSPTGHWRTSLSRYFCGFEHRSTMRRRRRSCRSCRCSIDRGIDDVGLLRA